MRLQGLLLAMSCISYPVQGCGNSGNTLGDAGPDGATDGSLPETDAANDARAADGATSSTITSWTCGTTTVSDCSQCTGFPQPCTYCNLSDASAITGVCTLLYNSCLLSIPNNYTECRCNNTVSNCPESHEICDNLGFCHTCSDDPTNNGLTCQNAGKCNYVDGGCL